MRFSGLLPETAGSVEDEAGDRHGRLLDLHQPPTLVALLVVQVVVFDRSGTRGGGGSEARNRAKFAE